MSTAVDETRAMITKANSAPAPGILFLRRFIEDDIRRRMDEGTWDAVVNGGKNNEPDPNPVRSADKAAHSTTPTEVER